MTRNTTENGKTISSDVWTPIVLISGGLSVLQHYNAEMQIEIQQDCEREAETQTNGREDFVEMCAGAVRGDAMGCSRIRDPSMAQRPGA
jgi:hypothetical protein